MSIARLGVAVACLIMSALQAGAASTAASQSQPADRFDSKADHSALRTAKPVLNLLAPSDEYGAKFDRLVPETALRMVAIDLAARSDKYARFWPADQLERVPSEAWPRIELYNTKLPATPYLKILRQGDLFTFYASADGSEYLNIGQVYMAMPARTCVGLFAYYDPEGKKITIKATDLRLNGKPLSQPKHGAIGPPVRPADVDLADKAWTMSTYGGKLVPSDKDRDWRESGELGYVNVDGDFELSARVEALSSESKYSAPTIMCRAGLELDAPTVCLVRTKNLAIGMSRMPPYTYLRQHLFYEGHLLNADLETGPGKSRRIGSVAVSYVNWDVLTRCAERLADQVQHDLPAEVQGKPDKPQAVEATAEQLGRLKKARDLALQVDSRDVLAASRIVDGVLAEAPLCPQAHYTAALCGAVLGLSDVCGRFRDAGQFLAGPLSHLLYAQRLAPPREADDVLSTAWVMFVTGYPDAALRMLKTLPEDQQAIPESKALSMFITCDYRPFDPESVVSASRMEQLAWVWGCRLGGRNDLVESVGPALAESARTPVYAIRLHSTNWNAPVLAERLALARDINDLLSDDRIPVADRTACLDKMTGLYRLSPQEDLAKASKQLAWAVYQRGPSLFEQPRQFGPTLGGLIDLYATAISTSGGPVSADSTIRWQCLCPHDFAETQRGLLLLAILDHAIAFRGLGLPEATKSYSEGVAEALAHLPAAQEFFKAYKSAMVGQWQAALQANSQVLDTPFGKHPVLAAMMIQEMTVYATPGTVETDERFSPGRGCWEWDYLAYAAMQKGMGWLSNAHANRSAVLNPYSCGPMSVMLWCTQDIAVAEPFLARCPYSLTMLNSAVRYARQGKQYQALCERIIDLTPKRVDGYYDLAWYYRRKGDRAKAIETARRAVEKCEYSIGLTNLMGDAAQWLVDENQLEEALQWGRRSATSASGSGVRGLAIALKANGKVKEAEEAYRENAFHYDGAVYEYIAFLVEQNTAMPKIFSEVNLLLKQYPSMREHIAGEVAKGFNVACADPSLMEKVYAGPLSFVSAMDQKYWLFVGSMYARHFDRVVDLGLEVDAARPLSCYDLMWLHHAMRLSGKTDQVKQVEKKLAARMHDGEIAPHIRYVLGQISWDELCRQESEGYGRCYAFWLRGIEKEIAKDTAGAIDAYAIAGDTAMTGDAPWLCYSWHKLLTRQLAAASQADR